jgi:hypothetical protein
VNTDSNKDNDSSTTTNLNKNIINDSDILQYHDIIVKVDNDQLQKRVSDLLQFQKLNDIDC